MSKEEENKTAISILIKAVSVVIFVVVVEKHFIRKRKQRQTRKAIQ